MQLCIVAKSKISSAIYTLGIKVKPSSSATN
jgi:hypothetical protein